MANAAITVDLNAKIAQFETELKRATGTLDAFGKKGNQIAAGFKSAFGGLASALSVGALATFAKQGIDAADALNDMSQRLGVTVKDLASFKLAAEQSGSSLEGVGLGIARLTRSIGEAEAGNKKLAAALGQLGITSRDPKEAFYQLADAVQRIEDPSRRAALLSQVLGKSYQDLIPLLAQGGDELRRSAAASETFADAMSRLAPEADKFNDQLALLKINAAGAAASILSELVPSFNEWIAVGQEVIKTGNLLDKIRFFGLGNASDEIVGKVRKAAEEAAKASAAARKAAASAGDIKLPPARAAAAKSAKSSDPLAGLISSTDIGRTQEYNKLLDLLNKRYDNGKKNAELYGQALKKLNDQFGKSQIDVFDSGSFKTTSKEVADFIKAQQEAINGLNGEMGAEAQQNAEAYKAKIDSLFSGTTAAKAKELHDNIAAIDKAFFDGEKTVEEWGEAIKSQTSDAAETLKETKTLAEELGLTFTSAFEDAIVGGKSFRDILKGIEQDILRIVTRKLVTEPLGTALTGFLGGLMGTASANGNAFDASGVKLAGFDTGGIASGPTSGYPVLMHGTEAVLPLKRGRNGKLGVESQGGGGTVVHMHINTPDANSFRKSTGQITAQVSGALSRARRNM